MNIVIDIPEKIYDAIMDDQVPCFEEIQMLCMDIVRGTPLPKGHGRLIDADELYLDIQTDEEMRLGEENLLWVRQRIYDVAPTVIEADSGKEQK